MRTILVLLLLLAAPAVARTIDVKDDDGLRAALRGLQPGDVVRLAPGEYRGGLTVEEALGTLQQPIVIEGADPERPPVIVGGGSGLHLVAPTFVTLRHLVARGATGNGINIDDGGLARPSAGVRVERCRVERVGPKGNCDALKLSGLSSFQVVGCTFEGWGGSGVDMVGCADGVIEGCRFVGAEGFTQSSGIQAKGGSIDITIRGCTFLDAGSRAINAGGSTGLEWFRPKDAPHEAKNIIIEGCRFRGSEAPIAFVGLDGGLVRFNTFVRPRKWLFRILQERTEARFAPCRDVRIEDNLVVYRRADVQVLVNIGPSTRPETFRLARNAWFCEDAPPRSKPDLPQPIPAEEQGVHGVDPRLTEELALPAKSPVAQGADRLPPPPKRRR